MSEKPHPWGVYQHARADYIDWLKEEYPEATDRQIAKKLSMDEDKVFAIRTRDRTVPIYQGLKITVEREEWIFEK